MGQQSKIISFLSRLWAICLKQSDTCTHSSFPVVGLKPSLLLEIFFHQSFFLTPSVWRIWYQWNSGSGIIKVSLKSFSINEWFIGTMEERNKFACSILPIIFDGCGSPLYKKSSLALVPFLEFTEKEMIKYLRNVPVEGTHWGGKSQNLNYIECNIESVLFSKFLTVVSG